MTRSGEHGKGKIVRRFLSLGLAVCTAYAFGISTLGGCGGAAWPSNGKLPARVVDKLTECGKNGPTPLESVKYDLTFTVHVSEDSEEARVDDVVLTGSTLHLHEVEACMTNALYGMRTPLEALALRQRRSLAPDRTFSPETRALLGQAQLGLLLELLEVFAVGYALYTVVVVVVMDKPHAKPRPHPAKPETEEPPAPAPVLSAVTAAPTATGVPTVTSVPIATAVPTATSVHVDCKKVKQDCIETCSETSLPTPDFGVKFRRCMRACMAAKGCLY